jgi:protoporphyrinogen oxidase
MSKIYYRNRFFDYPFSLSNALANLGPIESTLIALSYLKAFTHAALNPENEAKNFEEWAIERFGSRLYNLFFKSYIEKIWGIPTREIQVEWAEQYIPEFSLTTALDLPIERLRIEQTLLQRPDLPAPPASLEALKNIKYRDRMLVSIVANNQSPWLDQWPDHCIYIHSPELQVGRIHNFKAGSAARVIEPHQICWGMEYFCSEGDRLWEMNDAALIRLATEEIVEIGIVPDGAFIENGTVLRQKKAYPLYNDEYHQYLTLLKEYSVGFENLQGHNDQIEQALLALKKTSQRSQVQF